VSAMLALRLPRTARVVAITLLWIMRTVASLLVASPVVFAILGSGLTNGTERDALLFRPGSLVLLELVRTDSALLGSALKTALALFAVCALLGLVPLGAALELLHRQEVDAFSTRFARGVRLFPRFVGLSAIALLAQAAVLLAASLLGTALSSALHGRDERMLTLTPLGLFGVGLLVCAWLGALLDVARCIVVDRDLSARAALADALAVLRDDPLAILLGSYASFAGSVFAWLGSAWVLTKLDLTSPTTRGIALAFAVHQAAVMLGIALRVRWLDRALALGARTASASARD
jgi:hypothetical protein